MDIDNVRNLLLQLQQEFYGETLIPDPCEWEAAKNTETGRWDVTYNGEIVTDVWDEETANTYRRFPDIVNGLWMGMMVHKT